VVTEADLELTDGRTLHYYDTREDGSYAHVAVFWHHGTPNVGSPPEPLFPAAADSGLRWVVSPGGAGVAARPGSPLTRRARA
jgi:hypothetical protein